MASVGSLHEMYKTSLQWFGLPYIWGGDGPPHSRGFDCSGLVQRIIALADADPKGDQTADTLYRHFLLHGIRSSKERGALAFFGTYEKISHVGWMIDRYCMLNASGGGAHTTTTTQANSLGASVKIQPISIYKLPKLIDVLMPNYVFKSQ